MTSPISLEQHLAFHFSYLSCSFPAPLSVGSGQFTMHSSEHTTSLFIILVIALRNRICCSVVSRCLALFMVYFYFKCMLMFDIIVTLKILVFIVISFFISSNA